MSLEDHERQPATVLRGHVSEDSAYLVDDYPYGYTLRCQIRYWLHTARMGTTAGQLRFMSQTTNPKANGRWNKPKASTYTRWAVMIRDSRGHVDWWPVNDRGPRPSAHVLMRLRTIYGQLTDEEREGYDQLLDLSRTRSYAEEWERTARAYPVINEMTPEELWDTHGIYLDDRAHQILVAAHTAGLEL